MEMNSKVVPSLGHCFANLFLHGITKQPVHCIGLSYTDASACPIVLDRTNLFWSPFADVS